MNWTTFCTVLIGAAAIATSAFAQPRDQFGAIRTQMRTGVHYASSSPDPLEEPPAGVFARVTYRSAVGELGAYVTPDPGDGARHPAIIWMTGGETNTIGDVWSRRPADNDQSAAAYRQAGIVMMFPSLRGGNRNPGRIEGFFGEIDDVIAAADYLASLPYVDPQRIYLGGHSTGGTLVFLAAEASDRFRATFSFGPVAYASVYAPDLIPVDFSTLPAWEDILRAPVEWMPSVRRPLFVIEGTDGNIEHLRGMRQLNQNANITFLEAAGGDHFGILAPINRLIAQKILADTGAASNITLTEQDITQALRE
ncbi:MAG: alpha/beta hydrolase family protein [Hyphomonadaceae bacterium]